MASDNLVTIMITSPLEPEHAEQIANAHPAHTELIYRPDLLPPARYVADHDGDSKWTRTPKGEAEWTALLSRAEVLWDFAKDDGHPLERSPGLKWVQTTSAGVGQAVRRLGVQPGELIITTASGVHAQPLAEFVFAALLYHVKQYSHLQAEQRTHRWARFCTGELSGQTMAIIGPGRIGREVARLAKAFNMRVIAMGRTNTSKRAIELGVNAIFPRQQLHDMLGLADCVVLCAPHTPETEDMIGRAELRAMKPGVVLVNIARGAMVDEPEMIRALEDGHIGFAALDVFREEPLPSGSPLWDLPNVLISPHSASTAWSENGKLTERFIENLAHYLAGDLDAMQPQLDVARLY
ncbi:MAG: D-2-hydroxyacid dehydrogenase [Chloroflexota bacterium]|nr:D-2-hydroxyacid dehydrogenase [Chloroflexota bacterium]